MTAIADLTAASLRTQQAYDHAQQQGRDLGMLAYEIAKAAWEVAVRERNRIAVQLQPGYAERVRRIGESAWAMACVRWPEVRAQGMVEQTEISK